MQEHKSKESSNKTAFLLITIAVTYLMLGSMPVFAQAVVSITPESSTVETNETFSVFVNIEPDTPFVGVQLNIDFDESLITANKVVEGELFGGNGILHIFSEGSIDNQLGTISGLYAAVLGGTWIDDTGVFVEVEFTSADQTGYSDLGLSDLILSNSEGKAIPVAIESEGITIIDHVDETSETGSDSGSASSGSGGGGGAGSSEDEANIDIKEAKSVYVNSNADVSYKFDEKDSPIDSISYHSLKNAGHITSTIEVLKDISATVTGKPSGKVYRYVNIWVGKYGYATEENIENAVIGFSVPKEWLTGNGLDAGSVRLNRFSEGKWNELETSIVEEDTDTVLFEATTPGFSPFAITSAGTPETDATEEETVLLEENTDADDEQKEIVVAGESTEKSPGLAQNSALLAVVSLVAIAFLRKD